MSIEPERSPLSQQLVNGDSDGTGHTSAALTDSKHSEFKEAVGRPVPHIQTETRSHYPENESPKPVLPQVPNQNQGFAPPPLRRTDSRSFQPSPQPRPSNPLNFQPAQGWQRPPTAQFHSNPDNRPSGQLNSPTENRPYIPNNESRPPQSNQYNPTSEFRPPQQFAPRPPPQGNLDPSRKVPFNPNPNPSPPRQLQPGAVRRPSPWSVLKDKLPADQVRPGIRPYQFQNYPMNPQPPSQTPPQDPQKRLETDPMQRNYSPQDPGKAADILRGRSPMPPTSGRDSPTTQYTPGQQPPPRPVMMQRTDSMQSMPRDPRFQQPFSPRPPRSPNRFDDDDVVVGGDPRMMMARGSPRPPVPTGSPFNKYPGGQETPRNMSSPLAEAQKYLARTDSIDGSKNVTPSQSPFLQGMPRSPIPNKTDYQNSPALSPKPTYSSPSPAMQPTTQSPILRTSLPSNVPDKTHDSPTPLISQEDKPKTPINQYGTSDPIHKTPEPPKSSPTPTPPTKPPEMPSRPETPSRNLTFERPSTPVRMATPNTMSHMPERPSSLKRTPSEKDTPVVNGTNSEMSSGRTSRTDSIQDGIMNARNLEKMERQGPPQRTRIMSGKKSKDGDHDSGVDESTQGNEPTTNGDVESLKKSSTKIPTPKKLPVSPTKSMPKTPTKTTPKTPETPGDKKKVPMNKIQVGAAPSPNLKVVKSKIGSLDNTSYKPGGGKVKIENRKLDWKAQPRIAAKNDTYTPGGGDKKIQQVKLQWNAKSKVGSMDNATHKPGGGDKKIESVKLDFKDKAKPKIGSKDNMKHTPGGGSVKNSKENGTAKEEIEDQKVEIKATSKIGSLDNVKHRPGGGDKKIFDDKEYLKQMTGVSSKGGSEGPSGTQVCLDKDLRKPSQNINRKSTLSHSDNEMKLNKNYYNYPYYNSIKNNENNLKNTVSKSKDNLSTDGISKSKQIHIKLSALHNEGKTLQQTTTMQIENANKTLKYGKSILNETLNNKTSDVANIIMKPLEMIQKTTHKQTEHVNKSMVLGKTTLNQTLNSVNETLNNKTTDDTIIKPLENIQDSTKKQIENANKTIKKEKTILDKTINSVNETLTKKTTDLTNTITKPLENIQDSTNKQIGNPNKNIQKGNAVLTQTINSAIQNEKTTLNQSINSINETINKNTTIITNTTTKPLDSITKTNTNNQGNTILNQTLNSLSETINNKTTNAINTILKPVKNIQEITNKQIENVNKTMEQEKAKLEQKLNLVHETINKSKPLDTIQKTTNKTKEQGKFTLNQTLNSVNKKTENITRPMDNIQKAMENKIQTLLHSNNDNLDQLSKLKKKQKMEQIENKQDGMKSETKKSLNRIENKMIVKEKSSEAIKKLKKTDEIKDKVSNLTKNLIHENMPNTSEILPQSIKEIDKMNETEKKEKSHITEKKTDDKQNIIEHSTNKTEIDELAFNTKENNLNKKSSETVDNSKKEKPLEHKEGITLRKEINENDEEKLKNLQSNNSKDSTKKKNDENQKLQSHKEVLQTEKATNENTFKEKQNKEHPKQNKVILNKEQILAKSINTEQTKTLINQGAELDRTDTNTQRKANTTKNKKTRKEKTNLNKPSDNVKQKETKSNSALKYKKKPLLSETRTPSLESQTFGTKIYQQANKPQSNTQNFFGDVDDSLLAPVNKLLLDSVMQEVPNNDIKLSLLNEPKELTSQTTKTETTKSNLIQNNKTDFIKKNANISTKNNINATLSKTITLPEGMTAVAVFKDDEGTKYLQCYTPRKK